MIDIKFVSYDGQYPNLCSGTLVLNIGGLDFHFGAGHEFPQFWHSGGCVWFDNESNEHVDVGSWTVDVQALPQSLKRYASQIEDIFNSNVPHGCCGGCI